MSQRQYRVLLQGVTDMAGFVTAFNEGLIRAAGGEWLGNNWDAFNDYLSWPPEDSYSLLLAGWSSCTALKARDLAIFEDVLATNSHVSITRT